MEEQTAANPQAPMIELAAAIGPETHREFFLFNFTRSAHMFPPISLIATVVLLVVTLIVQMVAAVPLWAYIAPALLLVGVVAFCAYSYLLAPAIEYKRFGPLATSAYQYKFYNDRFDYTVQGTAEKGSGSIEYDAFRIVYETGTGFYIYLVDDRAFLISKKQITDDQIVYLRGFFAGHFIKKFKCLCSENRTK